MNTVTVRSRSPFWRKLVVWFQGDRQATATEGRRRIEWPWLRQIVSIQPELTGIISVVVVRYFSHTPSFDERTRGRCSPRQIARNICLKTAQHGYHTRIYVRPSATLVLLKPDTHFEALPCRFCFNTVLKIEIPSWTQKHRERLQSIVNHPRPTLCPSFHYPPLPPISWAFDTAVSLVSLTECGNISFDFVMVNYTLPIPFPLRPACPAERHTKRTKRGMVQQKKKNRVQIHHIQISSSCRPTPPPVPTHRYILLYPDKK
ncbi:unnamed protein product [Ectocarpus fasciculatus]